jgi:hypothetical protein
MSWLKRRHILRSPAWIAFTGAAVLVLAMIVLVVTWLSGGLEPVN